MYYRVTIDSQTTTKQVTGTNITISDLCACTSYSIYINAVDEDNNDGEMAIMQTRTTICNATMTNGHGYKIKNGKTEILINFNIQDEYLVKSMINNISPFTTYICWGFVFNEAGNNELSELYNKCNIRKCTICTFA